jgi:hypothetical protein
MFVQQWLEDLPNQPAKVVLDKYEGSITKDLGNLDNTHRTLASLSCFEIFGLDDAMLDRATELGSDHL